MNVKSATTSGNRFVSLEIGRGVAALLVVLYHFGSICDKYIGATPSLSSPFRGGHAGVEYFFTLSGFIIYYNHVGDIGKREKFVTFFKKRFIRIIPMYWLVISLMTLAFIINPRWGVEKNLSFINVVMDYLLLPREGPILLPPAWTLEREFLFYAIFSISMLLPKLGIPTFYLWQLLIAAVSLFTIVSNIRPEGLIWFLFGVHNLGFMVGALCAWMILNQERPSKSMLMLILLIGAAGVFGIMLIEWSMDLDFDAVQNPSVEIGRSFLYVVSFGLIVYSCAASESNSRWRYEKYMLLFGASSYLIYIIHEPFASFFLKLTSSDLLRRHVGSNGFYILTIILVVGAAVFLHVWLERPVTQYLRKTLIRSYPPRLSERLRYLWLNQP